MENDLNGRPLSSTVTCPECSYKIKTLADEPPSECPGCGHSFTDPEERTCRVCGCTDDDCSQCIEKTGEPCTWIEPDLCSACEGEG